MSLIQKIKIYKEDTLIRKYKICHITFFKKEIGREITMWVLGIPVARFANRKHPGYSSNKLNQFTKALKNARNIVLWIDHSLGGGTNTYTQNQFKENGETLYIRMQYFAYYKIFSLTLCNTNRHIQLTFVSLADVMGVLERIKINEIVVNNLVGFPNSVEVLKFVSDYKTRTVKQIHGSVKVSFRGHDYHSICPSFNLLDSKGQYCKLANLDNCENCFHAKRLAESDWENDVLLSGATTIKQWREAWSEFFTCVLDEFIVFSKEVSKIFFVIYPQLEDKTTVIPHKTQEYPIVKIKPHDEINIAFLGEMDLACKGKNILSQMVNIIDEYDNIYLKVIGYTSIIHDKLTSTGVYAPKDLPSIMERENIDLVFISSIWPETFSYTTSEAINMGMPIACFNFGAPYERVLEYDKGLIITKLDARYALENIIKFIKKLRDN